VMSTACEGILSHADPAPAAGGLSGPRGRRFKSCLPDSKCPQPLRNFWASAAAPYLLHNRKNSRRQNARDQAVIGTALSPHPVSLSAAALGGRTGTSVRHRRRCSNPYPVSLSRREGDARTRASARTPSARWIPYPARLSLSQRGGTSSGTAGGLAPVRLLQRL
jgi:hypothetical protein